MSIDSDLKKDMHELDTYHHKRLFGRSSQAIESLYNQMRRFGAIKVATAILVLSQTACGHIEFKDARSIYDNQKKEIVSLDSVADMLRSTLPKKDTLELAVKVEEIVEKKVLKKFHKAISENNIEEAQDTLKVINEITKVEGNSIKKNEHLENDLRHIMSRKEIRKQVRSHNNSLNNNERKQLIDVLNHAAFKPTGFYQYKNHLIYFEKLPYKENLEHEMEKKRYEKAAENTYLNSKFANDFRQFIGIDEKNIEANHIGSIVLGKKDFIVTYEIIKQIGDIKTYPHLLK